MKSFFISGLLLKHINLEGIVSRQITAVTKYKTTKQVEYFYGANKKDGKGTSSASRLNSWNL